jgi:hypothetical protein
MSLDRVAGHPQYDYTGASKFIPQVWTKKLQKKFYPKTSLTYISNNDFEGEIKGFGDEVIIRGIPEITTAPYQKGSEVDVQYPESTATTLKINKGRACIIGCDDVDKVQSDLPLLNQWTEAAAKRNAIDIETDFLANIYTDAHASNYGATAGAITGKFNLGASGSPIQLTSTNIIDRLIDCGTVLGENNVSDEDCWMLVPEWVAGLIQKSDLKDCSMTGDSKSIIRTNVLGKYGRFNILKSNLLPYVAAGTESSGFQSFYIMFGHKFATTFANQFIKTEQARPSKMFATFVKSLNVYGYKVVNSQGLGYMYARQ